MLRTTFSHQQLLVTICSHNLTIPPKDPTASLLKTGWISVPPAKVVELLAQGEGDLWEEIVAFSA